MLRDKKVKKCEQKRPAKTVRVYVKLRLTSDANFSFQHTEFSSMPNFLHPKYILLIKKSNRSAAPSFMGDESLKVSKIA